VPSIVVSDFRRAKALPPAGKTSGKGSVGTLEAFENTVMDGLGGYPAGGGGGFLTPEAQLGAFNFTWSRSSGVASITVTNPISLNSAALHATAKLGIQNPSTGRFGTVNQELDIAVGDPCMKIFY
jgi:hypothetical protein